MRILRLVVALSRAAAAAQLPVSVFNVTSHGAKGDGRANDAPAIRRAMEPRARCGGGASGAAFRHYKMAIQYPQLRC